MGCGGDGDFLGEDNERMPVFLAVSLVLAFAYDGVNGPVRRRSTRRVSPEGFGHSFPEVECVREVVEGLVGYVAVESDPMRVQSVTRIN